MFQDRSAQLLGNSDAIRGVVRDAECAARCDAKVLITGETGVGKELVAQLIHERSGRSRNRLVAINCGGVPDSLLESELFGHARGSFTDAFRDKPGLLESAPGGTVFLDEVGEMSPRMQAILLRFLESGEVQRLGADGPHARVNVRLIAATNRDLQTQTAAGAFRQDLYFRLNVIRIRVPALRDRREDVPALIAHFVGLASAAHGLSAPEFSDGARQILCEYGWPGNVRELRNVVERLVLRSTGRLVDADDVREDARGAAMALPRPAARIEGEPEDRAGELVSAMLDRGESFWAAVHGRFMARDLTRSDLRAIVRAGLDLTRGNYRLMVKRFNMPAGDYKRFLRFLRAHDCHLSFHAFRSGPVFHRSTRSAPGDAGALQPSA